MGKILDTTEVSPSRLKLITWRNRILRRLLPKVFISTTGQGARLGYHERYQAEWTIEVERFKKSKADSSGKVFVRYRLPWSRDEGGSEDFKFTIDVEYGRLRILRKASDA